MYAIVIVLRLIYRKLQDILETLNLIAKRLEPPPPQMPASIKWHVGTPTTEE